MFSNNCRNISFDSDKGLLLAECSLPDGTWKTSWLNLNDCLYWRWDVIRPFSGPRNTGERKPFINVREDHLRRTVSLNGTILSHKYEREGNDSTTRWHMLWYGDRWNGKWTTVEATINLDDYVRNNNGLLEFVEDDVEPAAFWKKVVDLLAKLPMPGTPVVVVSVAADDLQRKREYANMTEDHEAWLRNTYVEGGKRIIKGVIVETQS